MSPAAGSSTSVALDEHTLASKTNMLENNADDGSQPTSQRAIFVRALVSEACALIVREACQGNASCLSQVADDHSDQVCTCSATPNPNLILNTPTTTTTTAATSRKKRKKKRTKTTTISDQPTQYDATTSNTRLNDICDGADDDDVDDDVDDCDDHHHPNTSFGVATTTKTTAITHPSQETSQDDIGGGSSTASKKKKKKKKKKAASRMVPNGEFVARAFQAFDGLLAVTIFRQISMKELYTIFACVPDEDFAECENYVSLDDTAYYLNEVINSVVGQGADHVSTIEMRPRIPRADGDLDFMNPNDAKVIQNFWDALPLETKLDVVEQLRETALSWVNSYTQGEERQCATGDDAYGIMYKEMYEEIDKVLATRSFENLPFFKLINGQTDHDEFLRKAREHDGINEIEMKFLMLIVAAKLYAEFNMGCDHEPRSLTTLLSSGRCPPEYEKFMMKTTDANGNVIDPFGNFNGKRLKNTGKDHPPLQYETPESDTLSRDHIQLTDVDASLQDKAHYLCNEDCYTKGCTHHYPDDDLIDDESQPVIEGIDKMPPLVVTRRLMELIPNLTAEFKEGLLRGMSYKEMVEQGLVPTEGDEAAAEDTLAKFEEKIANLSHDIIYNNGNKFVDLMEKLDNEHTHNAITDATPSTSIAESETALSDSKRQEPVVIGTNDLEVGCCADCYNECNGQQHQDGDIDCCSEHRGGEHGCDHGSYLDKALRSESREDNLSDRDTNESQVDEMGIPCKDPRADKIRALNVSMKIKSDTEFALSNLFGQRLLAIYREHTAREKEESLLNELLDEERRKEKKSQKKQKKQKQKQEQKQIEQERLDIERREQEKIEAAKRKADEEERKRKEEEAQKAKKVQEQKLLAEAANQQKIQKRLEEQRKKEEQRRQLEEQKQQELVLKKQKEAQRKAELIKKKEAKKASRAENVAALSSSLSSSSSMPSPSVTRVATTSEDDNRLTIKNGGNIAMSAPIPTSAIGVKSILESKKIAATAATTTTAIVDNPICESTTSSSQISGEHCIDRSSTSSPCVSETSSSIIVGGGGRRSPSPTSMTSPSSFQSLSGLPSVPIIPIPSPALVAKRAPYSYGKKDTITSSNVTLQTTTTTSSTTSNIEFTPAISSTRWNPTVTAGSTTGIKTGLTPPPPPPPGLGGREVSKSSSSGPLRGTPPTIGSKLQLSSQSIIPPLLSPPFQPPPTQTSSNLMIGSHSNLTGTFPPQQVSSQTGHTPAVFGDVPTPLGTSKEDVKRSNDILSSLLSRSSIAPPKPGPTSIPLGSLGLPGTSSRISSPFTPDVVPSPSTVTLQTLGNIGNSVPLDDRFRQTIGVDMNSSSVLPLQKSVSNVMIPPSNGRPSSSSSGSSTWGENDGKSAFMPQFTGAFTSNSQSVLNPTNILSPNNQLSTQKKDEIFQAKLQQVSSSSSTQRNFRDATFDLQATGVNQFLDEDPLDYSAMFKDF